MSLGRGSASQAMVMVVVLLCLLVQFEHVHAATYTVGGSGGWTFNTDSWPKGKRFRAGDVLGKFVTSFVPTFKSSLSTTFWSEWRNSKTNVIQCIKLTLFPGSSKCHSMQSYSHFCLKWLILKLKFVTCHFLWKAFVIGLGPTCLCKYRTLTKITNIEESTYMQFLAYALKIFINARKTQLILKNIQPKPFFLLMYSYYRIMGKKNTHMANRD